MTTKRIAVWAALLLAGALVGRAGAGLFGTDFNNIEYLCCDWGPAMTLPSATNAAAQFNDAEDEVYFLKQVTSFTRKKSPFGGRDEDIGKGVSIWLCKMKADGSGKTEIKELWRNPTSGISANNQSSWMSVNRATRSIAFSIIFSGAELDGLWTMNLDGSNLRRIIKASKVDSYSRLIDSPSWTPDGQWIVFVEGLRGTGIARIVKCDLKGELLTYLTEGSRDNQSRVSPDGQHIAYIHWIKKGEADDSWLWLMDIDGKNQKPLINPNAKKSWSAPAHWGLYPAWHPGGESILLHSSIMVLLGFTCEFSLGALSSAHE